VSSSAGSDALPVTLRERVVTAALLARAAGRATPAADPIPAIEGLRRSVDALGELLTSLSDAQWHAPALRGLDVQGLIGHLIGVEDDVHRALSGDQGAAAADHIASTQAVADGQHGRPTEATRREWAAATTRALDLLAGADPDQPVAVHGLRLTVHSLCIVRTFEVWTHENDIRRALGLPQSDPDASALTLMTQYATSILPRAAAARQLPTPVSLRLVLTGPGGGTWQLRMGGDQPRAVEVGVVTGAVAFCRLIANRQEPTDLELHVTGDPALASALLHAATTLALD
jgi:uncharacterized protein (TIGR03083 family)